MKLEGTAYRLTIFVGEADRSTLEYETIRLAESGARGYTVLNVALTLTAGLAAVWSS